MSASSRPASLAVSSQDTLPAITKSLLDFDNIYDLINQGLINFIACFSRDENRSNDFKEKFAASLLRNPADKINFNQLGVAMVKAAYPGIVKLTNIENDILFKMGILSRQQNAEASIGQFFKKEEIKKFIELNVKDKYKEDIFNITDAIYKFIVTATCSIECEQLLVKYDKHNQLIVDKVSQDAIFSGIDLQLATATNNLKLTSDKLIAIKTRGKSVQAKGKTSKISEITKSLEKIRGIFAKAAAEYAGNLAEQRAENLKRQHQAMASAADQEKVKLQAAHATLQSVQAQLDEERRRTQELEEERRKALEKAEAERRKAEELAALAEEQQKALEKAEKERRQMQVAVPEEGQSSSSQAAASSSLSEVDMLHKEIELLHEQQRVKERASEMASAAKQSNVGRAALSQVFQVLMVQLGSVNCNTQQILQKLIAWEQAALSYLENKKPSKSSAVARRLPSMMVSTINFFGRTTRIGEMKATDPEQSMAFKTQVVAIIQQCLLITEQDRDFINTVKMLNQHIDSLASHSHQGTVSRQFIDITRAMTRVAEEVFEYKKPAPTLDHAAAPAMF